MIDKHIETKLTLIRDTLLGIGFHSQNPEAMLYPFLDCVMLLHQREIVLAIWKDGECLDVFLKDPSFLYEFTGSVQERIFAYCRKIQNSINKEMIINLGDGPYGLSIHKFQYIDDIGQGGVTTDVDDDATKLTFQLFDKRHNQFFDDNYYESIGRTIEQHITRTRNIKTIYNVDRVEMTDIEIKELLTPLQYALDNIFIDIGKIGSYLTLPSSIPNLFVAIRVYQKMDPLRKGMYDYTAMLMLQQKTKKSIVKWCKGKNYPACQQKGEGFQDCIDALEKILGFDTRVSADLVFSSGIIAFGVPTIAKKKQYDEEKGGQQARDVEKCIYKGIVQEFLTYFPIHIGGSPWLAMYTLATNDENERWKTWQHNYLFYRQVIQNVPGLIKQLSQEIYLDLISQNMADQIKVVVNSTVYVETVNPLLRKVAQIYPFPLIQFLDIQIKDDNHLSVPVIGKLSVSIEHNPFFPLHTVVKDITETIIIEHCQARLNRFANQQYFTTAHSLAQTTHTLKVSLDRLKSIAINTNNRNMLKIIKDANDIHEASAMMISIKKRDEIINKHEKFDVLESLVHVILDNYKEVTDDLKNKNVSSSYMASEAWSLLGDVQINIYPSLIPNVKVRYFMPLINIAMGELLSNAIKNNSECVNKYLKLSLTWSNSNLFFEVENSTLELEDKLLQLIDSLNNPEKSLIGITSLHSYAKSYWNSQHLFNKCISWDAKIDGDNRHIIARVLFAEEVQYGT